MGTHQVSAAITASSNGPTAAHGSGAEASDGHRRPVLRWSLLVLFGFVTLNAVYGGIGLMINGMGMPAEWLAATPFASWVLPGVALLALVAVPQAAALVLVARDRPDADRWAMWAGVVLMGWIVVQVAILGRFFFLQPVIFTFGAVEAGLAALRRR